MYKPGLALRPYSRRSISTDKRSLSVDCSGYQCRPLESSGCSRGHLIRSIVRLPAHQQGQEQTGRQYRLALASADPRLALPPDNVRPEEGRDRHLPPLLLVLPTSAAPPLWGHQGRYLWLSRLVDGLHVVVVPR